jgi:hypothetical protein
LNGIICNIEGKNNFLKRTFIVLLFLLFSLVSVSQEINNCGHFINKTDNNSGYQIIKQDVDYKISINGQLIVGNCLFESADKRITITAIEENVPSILRIYSLQGNLMYENQFNHIINPELTPNKAFLSFYCDGTVNIMDLQKMSVYSCKSSIIYDVDSAGNPVCFDNKDIIYKGNVIESDEIPAKILQFKDRTLIFSRNNLYLPDDKKANKIFSFQGTYFDAQIQGDTLKFVLKEQVQNWFRFTLYKTNDLQNFIKGESTHYSTTHSTINPVKSRSKHSSGTGMHEDIRGPLNYYNDTAHYRIGNSYSELQEYGTGPYLHPGVDFLGDSNQDVYAVKTGVVKAILTTGGDLYWRIAIANNNTKNESIGYLYAHLKQASIPYTVGDSVFEGDKIGIPVAWPVPGFHHTHFARIKSSGTTWDGSWWTINNPLPDVTNLIDTVKPVFENSINNDLLAFRDSNEIYLSADSIYGHVDIICKVSDQCNSSYKIDVYQINYSLSPVNSPGKYLFDKLAFRFDMPVDVYLNSAYSTLLANTIYSFDQTCFSRADYKFRDYYHIITNSDGSDTLTANSKDLYFNSLNYPNGQYFLKVTAKDARLNTAMDSMLINIKNKGNSVKKFLQKNSDIAVFPNPSKNFVIIKFPKTENSILSIYNSKGQEVQKINNISDQEVKIKSHNWQSGLYFFRLQTENRIVGQGKFIIE